MSRNQVVDNTYEECLKQSVQEGLVACYSENDIALSPTPISSGGIRTYKAVLKRSGTPVAIKTLVEGYCNCTKELRMELIKEVIGGFTIGDVTYINVRPICTNEY